MRYLFLFFSTTYLTLIFTVSFASEIISVTPDFIKMRHAAEVTVKVKGADMNLQLSLIPGGAYINKSKTVSDKAILLNDLLFDVEQNTQVIIYRASKDRWHEIGFFDAGQPVKKLSVVEGKIQVTTASAFLTLDISKSGKPTLSSRHPKNDTAKTKTCTLSQDKLYPQALSFNSFCITRSNKNGIQVWKNFNNKRELISHFQTNTIPFDIILIEDRLVIANSTSGVLLLDIDKNGKLNWKGSYNKLGNIIHVAYSNQQLMTADDEGVLSIFDISNPTTPLLISNFHTHQSIRTIALHNNQAYLLTNNKVLNVDFSSNSSPLISTLGVNQGGSRRSFIENDILYVADWFSGLHLYDIRVPSAPRLLSGFHTPGSSKGVLVKNGIAYVADDDHGLQIIDVSNVHKPTFISEIPLTGLAYTMKLVDNLLYIASHRGGFHIVDVSNPKQPKLISTYDTPGKSWALEYLDGLLYVADDDSGVLVFDVKNPEQPILINQFNPGGFAEDIVLKDGKAYIAFFDIGLIILDISNPKKLFQLAHLTTPGNARGIEIVDDLLYLASWEAGVLIIDISSSTNPSIIGQYDTKGAVWGLSVQDKMIYAMDWWGGIKILNAKNASRPRLVSQYQTAGIMSDLIYHEQFIYTAQGSRGLQIYDASNDLNPVWATGIDISGSANGLTINKNKVIVAAGDGGIAIVDITNPFIAKLQSQLTVDSSIDLVQSNGDLVYAAEKNGDLFVIDISEPSDPQLFKRWKMKVSSLRLNGEYLFVLDNNRKITRISVKNMSEIHHYPLPSKADNFIFVDADRFVLQGNKQLTPCVFLQNSITCQSSFSLKNNPIALHVSQSKLYSTMENNTLYVFNLGLDKQLTLSTIYPVSHRITRISTSKYGIFFAGESIIASGKQLPPLSISLKKDHFTIKIPDNMPKGAYHLALTTKDGQQTIKKNAIIIGFPKLKSKFTLEQLKAIMKQKNFAGKAP